MTSTPHKADKKTAKKNTNKKKQMTYFLFNLATHQSILFTFYHKVLLKGRIWWLESTLLSKLEILSLNFHLKRFEVFQ